MWTIYITNDNCPDYTWGLTEARTRRSFAEIVRAHLDEMNRTDEQPPPNRDRYNMAVTQEALYFLQRYPHRTEELIRRIRQGRLYLSPFLCNSMWGLQSVEGVIRTLYPARRLERQWGIAIDVAEHTEQPSLPWGVASILAGCGVRWLSVPFYDYDSTFGGLKNPPLFILEGPDGGRIRVVMDPWACRKAHYTQGAALLREPKLITTQWLGHYRRLGQTYPLRAVLASGTHGDISPRSGAQARGFAEAIIQYNARPGRHPRLVNATLPQFCQAVDAAEEDKPFLRVLRGSFGHSWELWPVSLARYAADMRAGERAFLAAEALLAVASRRRPELHQATRPDRERAEWCWAMLSDHAWNGTDDKNRRHNADLRARWSRELTDLAGSLLRRAWTGLGLTRSSRDLVLFNSLSLPRADVVRIEPPAGVGAVVAGRTKLNCQIVVEDGRRVLYFVSPELPGFGLRQLKLVPAPARPHRTDKLRATPTELEGPTYRLKVDLKTGGIASLIHKPSGTELVTPGSRRSLCQTIYFDGKEHTLREVTSEVLACGPVMARLRIRGKAAGVSVTNLVTVYADASNAEGCAGGFGLDRVDFDLRIHKPVTDHEQRLCQVFPVLSDGAELRIETTGAVIRPLPQPAGDLLPGADPRRFAVQGFVDASPNGPGVTIAPLESFALRLDLDPITFQALGNDQNYREVVQDQHGIKEFRFRYSLRAHAGGFNRAEAFAFSRSVAWPMLAETGRLPRGQTGRQAVVIDPARAIATCLKPADGEASGGCILRLWEVAGRSGPIRIGVRGYKRAIRTDLLERDLEPLRIAGGEVSVELRAHGFGAVRLLP